MIRKIFDFAKNKVKVNNISGEIWYQNRKKTKITHMTRHFSSPNLSNMTKIAKGKTMEVGHHMQNAKPTIWLQMAFKVSSSKGSSCLSKDNCQTIASSLRYLLLIIIFIPSKKANLSNRLQFRYNMFKHTRRYSNRFLKHLSIDTSLTKHCQRYGDKGFLLMTHWSLPSSTSSLTTQTKRHN